MSSSRRSYTDTTQSVPLSLGAMFQPYFELGDRVRKHYFAPSVLLCLVSGQFVPPIHRRNLYSLQYSMLPAKRASVGELWKRLREGGNGAVHVPTGYPSFAVGRVGANGGNGRKSGK